MTPFDDIEIASSGDGPAGGIGAEATVATDGDTATPTGAAMAAVAAGAGAARRRRVLGNTIANGIARAVSVGSSFLLTPIILGVVGREAYALWVLIGSLVAYGTLLDLGIGGALTRYIAAHRAKGETDEARQLVAVGLRLYLLLGALMAVVGLLLIPLVPTVFNVPPPLVPQAQAVTGLMAIGIGVAIPCSTAPAILRGLQRYDLVAWVTIAGSLIGVGATLVALAAGWGVVGIVALSIPTSIAAQLLAVLAIRRTAPDLLGRADGPRMPTARRIISFSWPLLGLDIAGRLQTKTDEIVVGVALSLGAVTPYALGRKLATFPRMAAEQFTMLLLPLASELDARDDRERLRKLYLTGVRASVAIALPLTALLAVLGGNVLDVWVGHGYGDGAPVVAILALAAVVDLSLWPAGFVLQGVGRHHRLAPIALASGFANLLLSIALAGPFGIIGVALGTLVPTLVEAVLFVTPLTLRTLDLATRRFLRDALLPATLPLVPMLAVLALAMVVIPPSSLGALLLLVVVGHVAYGVVYLAMGPAAPERRMLRELGGSVARAIGR